MRAVVDASIAFLMLTDPERVAPSFTEVTDIIAPEFIVAELLNVCWKLARSGASAPAINVALALLERFRLVACFPYAADAAALAQRLDHPVYDCLYAAVAKRERALFVTADRRFAVKLAAKSIDVTIV